MGYRVKIFVSWSGEKSLAVANLLKTWLPSVLQAVDEVWLSSEDIRGGSNWSTAIGNELATTSLGIVCVTQENQERPWLNFEAGAISKLVGDAVPLLVDFPNKNALRQGPMSQLQVRTVERDEMSRLLADINERLERPLEASMLQRSFGRAWTEFHEALNNILENPSFHSAPPTRSEGDKIDEILTLMRGLTHQLPAVVAEAVRRNEQAHSTDDLRVTRTPAAFSGTGTLNTNAQGRTFVSELPPPVTGAHIELRGGV